MLMRHNPALEPYALNYDYGNYLQRFNIPTYTYYQRKRLEKISANAFFDISLYWKWQVVVVVKTMASVGLGYAYQ